MYIIGGILTMGIVMQYVYLPVFHDLKLTSTYHYLAIRFDHRIRMFGSILFALGMVSQVKSVILLAKFQRHRKSLILPRLPFVALV